MFSASTLAAALSLLTFAMGNPILAPRQTCRPNFIGRALSIYRFSPNVRPGVLEWTPDSKQGGHVSLSLLSDAQALKSGEFLVEFTGQPSGTYHIKSVANTMRDLALSAGPGGQLTFATAASDGSQDFAISCNQCVTGVARAMACVVSHPATNTCVTGVDQGENLVLAQCNGSAEQSYEFSEAVILN